MSSIEQALNSFQILTCIAEQVDDRLSVIAWDDWLGLPWIRKSQREIEELRPFIDSFRPPITTMTIPHQVTFPYENNIARAADRVTSAYDSFIGLGLDLEEPLSLEEIQEIQTAAENAVQENLVPFFNSPR